MTSDRQLHLNLFIYPDGHHEAAWRHPDSETDRILDIAYYQELAQRAEAAKFDAVFFADGPSLAENIQYAARFRARADHRADGDRRGDRADRPDRHRVHDLQRALQPGPAVRVARPPQQAAGPAGTSSPPAPPTRRSTSASTRTRCTRDRYERAEEFVDVVTKLWDSWEDDAVVADQESGHLRRPRQDPPRSTTSASTSGSTGPLNAPRSPQGRPVYVQAGSSEDGRAFAAR